jgi:hypothetical protein
MVDETQNNFSYWFPKIENCGIAVPKSIVFQTGNKEFIEHCYMENPNKDIEFFVKFFRETVIPKMREAGIHLPFLKNATFSNKFDAKASCFPRPGAYEMAMALVNVNYNALMVGADGLTEVVVRERIPYENTTPTIYDGLPLRPEFRVFYDFDKKEPMYCANYWDFDYVYPNLFWEADKIIFEHERLRIETTYKAKKDEIVELVANAMLNVEGLSGQWSVDIMIDEEKKPWLIDMAIAQRSAYYRNTPEEQAEEDAEKEKYQRFADDPIFEEIAEELRQEQK